MKFILLIPIATSCVVTPLTLTAQTPTLLRTFTNPTPAVGDSFGISVAALGNDCVLVGVPYDDASATNAGIVYLFHTNGALITTFTNPHPASPYLGGDRFGIAVAAVGMDRVLIGAARETRAYLFNTNGALVVTIESPHLTDDPFGSVVGAFDNDRVLIGTPEYSSDPEAGVASGLAYLYSTNGSLLAILDNPEPYNFDLHGSSLAALGSDRVIVGAPGRGVVRLYSTNGTLLNTITNPAPDPDAYFGRSVAAVGTDRIFVSAYGEDTLGSPAGSVYMFNTNGTLLNTITNPTPAYGVAFGAQMAMLGDDRVVISAPRDYTTAFDSGLAYVFDINGTLLATINNPTPAIYDYFGWSVASFGSEGVIIAEPWDNAGATNSGSVYLFSIPALPMPPSLSLLRTTTNTVVVLWPAAATGFVLQQNANGLSSGNWSNVTTGIQNDGTNKSLVVNPTSQSRFYRLLAP